MAKEIISFRDLIMWQKSMELVTQIYKITSKFPQHEQFRLMSQMRRSAVSIPSDIAEGSNRRYSKEYIQFLNIVLGLCSELETQIEIAYNLKYIAANNIRKLLDTLHEVGGMLNASMRTIYKNTTNHYVISLQSN